MRQNYDKVIIMTKSDKDEVIMNHLNYEILVHNYDIKKSHIYKKS